MADLPGDKTFERYCTFQRGNERGFATRKQHAEVMRALLDRWRCEPLDAMGRGGLFSFPVLLREGILREYRRGGFVGRFLQEGTLTNRPLIEWEVTNRLYAADFPVPAPLGVVWKRRRFLYTGAIATQRIDAVNLAAYLAQPDGDCASLLETAGALIRRMHDLSVFHADLHVGNILVARERPNGEQVYFVDFDNARIAAVSQLDRARNMLRLRRSFLKRGLRMTDFEHVLGGYGPLAVPGWLDSVYEIKGALSDALNRLMGTHAP